MSTGPGPCLWIVDHRLGPRGWDEVCRPDPGRTFSHDPQACQKDRVRWREGRDVLDGVTLITRSGRDGGATSPGPCCRNPLSITMCGAVCVWRRPATWSESEWTDSPWPATRMCRFCWKAKLCGSVQAQARHEQRQGSLAWLAGWLAGLLVRAHAVSGSDLLQTRK